VTFFTVDFTGGMLRWLSRTPGASMNAIGFVISRKENERRRAVLPEHLAGVWHTRQLVFESNYGAPFGIPDSAYRTIGCRVAPRDEVYACAIICNPKAPEPAERPLFRGGQTLFGWVHAVQGRAMVDFLVERKMTAIAWEDMYERKRHTFWRNNEIAGEAAVLHAINFLGWLPSGLRAALIGLGNCGRGAFRILSQLGCRVDLFTRATSPLLREQIHEFDIIVNAVMWDVFDASRLIGVEDLRRMRRGSMIIDISCDERMEIESSHPTPIYDPVYELEGILHYAVDHTPAIYWRSATEAIGRAVAPFLDRLVTGSAGACLRRATIIRDGVILDPRILRFQNREDPRHSRTADATSAICSEASSG
jgi:N5-(carboxyethyl)ornithine synthase